MVPIALRGVHIGDRMTSPITCLARDNSLSSGEYLKVVRIGVDQLVHLYSDTYPKGKIRHI